MAVRLTPKAYGALRLLDDTSFKQRAKTLESIDEWGFALLLYWNQIEAALKLMRYGYSIGDGWPNKLDFIRSSWGPLKRLKLHQCDDYEIVLGTASSSLRNRRNAIAHEGCNLSSVDYCKYVESARRVMCSFQKEVPKVTQLREKKRLYEAKTGS